MEPRTTVSNATLEAEVTVSSLDAVEGSEAVNIDLDRLAGSLDVDASGASDIVGPGG